MIKDTEQVAREQLEAWMLSPETEVVPERGVCRLTKYKKSFGPDTVVKVDGMPLILKSSGRPLKACEVLPERADLALDYEGNLLDVGTFTRRYQEWLGAFIYIEDTELSAEPVPNIIKYVTECQDQFSESAGYIEIGFDPKLNQEWEPSESYDAEGRHMSDPNFMGKQKAEESVLERIMERMIAKLPPEAVAAALSDEIGKDIPIVGETTSTQEVPVSDTTVGPPMAVAPCGKAVKARGLAAHIRRCGEPACGPGSDNTGADQVANL